MLNINNQETGSSIHSRIIIQVSLPIWLYIYSTVFMTMSMICAT